MTGQARRVQPLVTAWSDIRTARPLHQRSADTLLREAALWIAIGDAAFAASEDKQRRGAAPMLLLAQAKRERTGHLVASVCRIGDLHQECVGRKFRLVLVVPTSCPLEVGVDPLRPES